MWEAPSMNAVFHLEGSFRSIKLVKSSHFVMKSHVGSISMNAVFHLEGSFRSIKLVKPSHFFIEVTCGKHFYERSVSLRGEI